MIYVIDILLKTQNMINPEISTKNSVCHRIVGCPSNGQSDHDLFKACLTFSENDFTEWCSQMQSEQLQSNFKVHYPQAVHFMRRNFNQYNKNWLFEIYDLQYLNEKVKDIVINTYKKFIQAILFMSDKAYLDSISFTRDIFLSPSRVYQLLSICKNISTLLAPDTTTPNELNNQIQAKQKNPQSQLIIFNTVSLFKEVVNKMEKNIETKMKMKLKYKQKIKIKSLEKKQNLLSQFNSLWRNSSQEQKQSIWYLGYNDIKKASRLIESNIKIDLGQIQEYVQFAQKIGTKELKDQIFSWRLCQIDNGITSYMQLIFNQICKRLRRNPKQSTKLKSRKQKKRRVRQRLLRRSSIDQSSNQTNETDITYQHAFDININQIIQAKIEKNIVELADDINIEANQYFDNRVQAYSRLKQILECLGISLQLYGSCCVGLAIRNSDVDVTISEKVLNDWYGYLGETGQRIQAFFTYLEYYFSSFPWISNVKIIGSATIPIIKFKIDTKMPLYQQQMYNTNNNFQNTAQQNESNRNLTQIDLTIQTTQPSRKHLGIVSTKKTQQWLNQIPTLQMIAIILKNQLAIHNLNEAYYGGLNTYTLLVIILAVIYKQNLKNENKVSKVLEKVLKFYSQQFEQQKYGIDLDSPEIFYLKKLQPGELQINPKLQVKDPQGDHKIITRNCYQFKKIKQIFSSLYKTNYIQSRIKIQQLCSIWNPKQNPFDQQMLMNWIEKQIGVGVISGSVLNQKNYQGQIQNQNQYQNQNFNEGMKMLKSE